MESILFHGNRHPLPDLVHKPSAPSTSSLAITKLHFSQTQANNYISLTTKVNTSRPPRQVLTRPVIRAQERSRNDRKDNKKTAQGRAGASIALACVLGIIGSSLKMNPKAIAGPRELYQKAPQSAVAYPLGGRSALKSLLDVNVCLASSKLEPPTATTQLPSRPSTEQVNDLIKMEAVRLMKYGKPKDAVLFLQDAYNLYKHDPEPAYNVEMALVEILICQGKYKEALKCNCLNDDQRLPSDGRFPLYKAIIYTMLDDMEEAKKWWEEYVETVEEEFNPTND
ncbi:hypothetical protein JCGZ_04618 [Jatropha curcas]|uniref:Uncharacterized protein n=1 Tax=Jatropha curcas TaxID=180498 RepID=A0A067L0F5_JATCU|nr:hypothetical protein JCGZ_04618 [Jatropha curcas]